MNVHHIFKLATSYNNLAKFSSRKDGKDIATHVFVMKSPFCPKSWKWDHIGFKLTDGSFKDMSGHRHPSPPIKYTYEETEDLFQMPPTLQEAIDKNLYQEKKLPKPIVIPDEVVYNLDNPEEIAENCGSFVKIVLHNNGIKTTTSDHMGDIFDKL